MRKVDLPWDYCIVSKDWEKVCSMDYQVQMDERHDPVPIAIEIGFNNPHTIVRIRIIEGSAKVMDKGA